MQIIKETPTEMLRIFSFYIFAMGVTFFILFFLPVSPETNNGQGDQLEYSELCYRHFNPDEVFVLNQWLAANPGWELLTVDGDRVWLKRKITL